MYYTNELKQQPKLLLGLAALAKHPAFLPFACTGLLIGGAALLVKKLRSKKYEPLDNVETTLIKPLDLQNSAEITESERLKQPLDLTVSTVETTVDSAVEYGSKTVEVASEISSEDIEKELIRRAMSELGKRSAQKRKERKQ